MVQGCPTSNPSGTCRIPFDGRVKLFNRNFLFCCDIDNSIAERFIRPLASERKNSLFFIGSRIANVSAAYHALLSTCRMNGLSALEYLKKFFREVVKSRRDYENLLPMTIRLSTNKHQKSRSNFEIFNRNR